jgi:hypothetical protein
MAKMFYTMDETKAALGKSEDDIRQLSREGKLREFRDGPRLMFKADQVDGLKTELASGSIGGTGDQIGLGSGDTHAPLGLADSKTGSGTGAAMNMKGDTATGMPGPKDDTAAGMDVGLSGSLSGSIGGGSLAGGSLGGTQNPNATRGGRAGAGVNVLGGDDADADPMAQTHMTPARDQISLEGVGSGSGLLDLTRETDDTSLGAALLDEISPGGSKRDKSSSVTSSLTKDKSGSTAGMTSISPMELPGESAPEAGYVPAPMVEVEDPAAPAFAAGAIAASLLMLVAGLVLIGAVTTDNPLLDARIPLARMMDKNFFLLLIVALVITILFGVGGWIVGKMSNRTPAV